MPRDLIRRLKITLNEDRRATACPALEFLSKQKWRLDWLYLETLFVIKHGSDHKFEAPGCYFTEAILRLRDVGMVEFEKVTVTPHATTTGAEQFGEVVGRAVSEMTSRVRGDLGESTDLVQDRKTLNNRIAGLVAEGGIVFTHNKRCGCRLIRRSGRIFEKAT